MRPAPSPLLACLLSAVLLSACQPGGQVLTVRSKANGVWQVDARARVAGGAAVFECLHSISGRCHFTLFGNGCLSGDDHGTQCNAQVLEHFSLAVDSRTSLRGMRDFRMCVSQRPGQVRPDCGPADAPAPRRG